MRMNKLNKIVGIFKRMTRAEQDIASDWMEHRLATIMLGNLEYRTKNPSLWEQIRHRVEPTGGHYA